MASTERSLGWATSGTGDGPLAGYDSSRWRALMTKSDGNGILLTSGLAYSNLYVSGWGTSTLTIADGAALINGYLYESNGTVTISTSGLTGTYSIVLVANNSAGTVTVTANGAGTTTIAASTVRIVVATSAQVTTITGTVGAANVVTFCSMVVTAGSITSINGRTSSSAYSAPVVSSDLPYLSSTNLPLQVYGYAQTYSLTSVLNTVVSAITFTSASSYGGSAIDASSSPPYSLAILMSGMYYIEGRVRWSANTTGLRVLTIGTNNTTIAMNTINNSISASNLSAQNSYEQQAGGVFWVSTGDVAVMNVWQNSGGTLAYSEASLRIIRL